MLWLRLLVGLTVAVAAGAVVPASSYSGAPWTAERSYTIRVISERVTPSSLDVSAKAVVSDIMRLRLLVANDPPFILDVDNGTISAVGGINFPSYTFVSVIPNATRTGIIAIGRGRNSAIFGITRKSTRATFLGSGEQAWVSDVASRVLWIKRPIGRGRCSLWGIVLNNWQQRRVGADLSCRLLVQPGGALGLVVARNRVIDPHTGRIVLRSDHGIIAVAGKKLVLRGPGRTLTLLDSEAPMRSVKLRWPSVLNGLDQPAADPQGRFVALTFAEPSWKATGKQAVDVWLLDVRTGRLSQLQGMPAFVSLKRTSLAWASDGRLVMLGERAAGEDFVAVWQPGQAGINLRNVDLPPRLTGSDSFSVLE